MSVSSGANLCPQGRQGASERDAVALFHSHPFRDPDGGPETGCCRTSTASRPLQGSPIIQKVADLKNITMSPILVARDGVDSSYLGNLPTDGFEPFPEYQEPPDDAIFTDLMDQIDRARAAASTFNVDQNYVRPPSAANNSGQGISRQRQAEILSLSKGRDTPSERGNAAANEETMKALAMMPSLSEWEIANNIMEEFMATGRGLSLEEIDALLTDLNETTRHNEPEESVITQQFTSTPIGTQLFTQDKAAVTNIDQQDDTCNQTHLKALGGFSLRRGGRVSPLTMNMKIQTNCGDELVSSPAFRDSAIHMDDDSAQARASLSGTPGFQDAYVADHNSPYNSVPDGEGANANTVEERVGMEDAELPSSPWMQLNPGLNDGEAAPPLPNVWIEGNMFGSNSRNDVPYDLGGFFDLIHVQGARNNLLMLWPEQEQLRFSKRVPRGCSSDNFTPDQAGRDEQELHDNGVFTSRSELCSNPGLQDAVDYCAPGYNPEYPEIFDSFWQQNEGSCLWETNDQPLAERRGLVAVATEGVDPMKTLNKPFDVDTPNLDFMDFRHLGRKDTNDSTFVNVSESTTPKGNAQISNGAPNLAFSAGQTLASNVVLPSTPNNARSVGRHPSQGLLTPTYGALQLTLPDITLDSPSIQVVKKKTQPKRKPTPKPKRLVGCPRTRDQALALAQEVSTTENVNQVEVAQPKPTNFRQVNRPKPYTFPQSPMPAAQRSSTPLLTSDATIDAPDLTPGSTTESQEFLTLEPPPIPYSGLATRSPYSLKKAPNLKPRSRGRSVSKKPKRTLSKTENGGTNAEEGKQRGEQKVARRSSRIIKLTEKALDLDGKDI